MTAAVSLRQPQARDVWLPTPSRADRDVPRASKGHCIVHAVFGDGEGVRVQAESLLEHKWQLILSARPETLELREQVLFRWGDRPTDKHVFDMVVKERSGRRIAYTVKPEIRLRSGRFLAEIQEIAYWVKFKQFADDVRLLTDTDLDPVELYNARVTAAVAKPDAEADSRAVALAATLPMTAWRTPSRISMKPSTRSRRRHRSSPSTSYTGVGSTPRGSCSTASSQSSHGYR